MQTGVRADVKLSIIIWHLLDWCINKLTLLFTHQQIVVNNVEVNKNNDYWRTEQLFH